MVSFISILHNKYHYFIIILKKNEQGKDKMIDYITEEAKSATDETEV